MMNKNIYLLEILTADLPSTKLNNILTNLTSCLLNNFQKHNVKVIECKSFITIKRISFIFIIDQYNDIDIRCILTDVFENIKFSTNMRWGTNKKSFVRPIKSFILMCNNTSISHRLFDVDSVNYILIGNKRVNVTPMNYYKLVRYKYNIICDFEERLTLLKKKIHFYLNKYKCHALLNDDILINTSNSFEYPCINIVSFNNIYFKLPMRIIIIILLSYGCIVLVKNTIISHLLIVIDSHKIKNIGQAYILAIKNKLLDIEAMRNSDALILKKISITMLKSVILNKNLDTIYSRIKRLFNLLNYISIVLCIKVRYIKKSVILLHMEMFSKFIFENIYLTGLLFIDVYNKIDVKSILYDYNKLFNNYSSNNLFSSILIIIENIDNVIFLFLNNNAPKGKNDPYNFKKKVILIITCILERKININFFELIKQAIKKFSFKKNDISTIFTFFVDKLKSHFNCKYIDFIKYKTNLYKAFELSKSIDFFFQYKLKYDFFSLLKRIENITSKNKILFSIKINKKLLINIDEKILFNKLIKMAKITTILIKNEMYFEKIKFDLTIQQKINKFFENTLVICQDNNIKNNRLKLLHTIRYLLNRVIILNIKNLEMIN